MRVELIGGPCDGGAVDIEDFFDGQTVGVETETGGRAVYEYRGGVLEFDSLLTFWGGDDTHPTDGW